MSFTILFISAMSGRYSACWRIRIDSFPGLYGATVDAHEWDDGLCRSNGDRHEDLVKSERIVQDIPSADP